MYTSDSETWKRARLWKLIFSNCAVNKKPETRRSSRPSVSEEEPNPKFQKKNEVHEQQANRRHQTLSHFDISFMLGYSWSSNTSARLYPI